METNKLKDKQYENNKSKRNRKHFANKNQRF